MSNIFRRMRNIDKQDILLRVYEMMENEFDCRNVVVTKAGSSIVITKCKGDYVDKRWRLSLREEI